VRKNIIALLRIGLFLKRSIFGQMKKEIYRITGVLIFVFVATLSSSAQNGTLDTLGITNGSVHITGTFPYTQFVKKYKGENDLTIHIWYNPSGSTYSKREVKAGKDEVYFLYGRNLQKGASEMDFKFGMNARKVFAKKKEKEMTELIDFLEFDVFPNQHFNGALAMEALEGALD